MSDDQDFPYLAEDRKQFRTQVAIAIVAVLAGVAFLAVKCSAARQRHQDIRDQMALNRALNDYSATLPPPTPRSDTAAITEAAPVELELVVGDAHHDVTGAAISLDDGRTVEIATRPEWTYSDADLSFTYSSSLRARRNAEDTILLGGDDAIAELAILPTDATEAEGLAELARTYESTGQVAASEETSITLLGRTVTARRIVTSGPVVEVAAVAAGKGKQLRVIITATSASADPAIVRKAVQTVTLAKRPPTPELDVTLYGPTDNALGTAEITVGKPFELAGATMTIARRATVRQQRGGMRFEHAPELTVTTIAGAAPTVALRSGQIGIQVMIAPFSINADELLQAMGVTVTDSTPLTRTIDGATYRGVAGDFQMGELALHTQAFTFDRGGRSFIVMIQSPTADAPRGLALAEPIMASVQ
ncbi:MAG TPA: hypothetical protein VM261_30435 [Kofleriaceae bacterium]|nr:hypothetical protein [Kofleriaceae bacterium]